MVEPMGGPVKILIVEDDALIAMELGERLGDFGYRVIGPAANIADAEEAVRGERPDIALLDANLAGQSSVGLGAALVRQGVRVAFCTGYDKIKDMPAELAGAPVLTKPISDATLQDALRKMGA
jgi:DNA-binding response OmpR family regulator